MSWFEGKRVLITGASSGIGAEFARQIHAAGGSVLLLARRIDRLQALADRCNRNRAGSAEVWAADLTQEQDVISVCTRIETDTVDVLINNAGRGSFGEFETLSREEECGQLALNCTAALHLTHAVLPQLKRRKEGGIIYVSSIAAFQPLPYMSTYAATKAFDLFHAMALRQECAESNVRVMALCPGPVATEFGGVARVPGTVTGVTRTQVDYVVKAALAGFEKNKAIVIPGGRAKAMAFMSSVLPFPLSSWLVKLLLRPALRAMRR